MWNLALIPWILVDMLLITICYVTFWHSGTLHAYGKAQLASRR